MLVIAIKKWPSWSSSKRTFIIADDFVLLHSVNEHVTDVQLLNNGPVVAIYSIPCSDLITVTFRKQGSKLIICTNSKDICVLEEYLYIVKTVDTFVYFSVNVTSAIPDLQFRVSIFDDYNKYIDFQLHKHFDPLFSNITTPNSEFELNFTSQKMVQEAAYYYIAVHPNYPNNYTKYNHYNVSAEINYVIGYYNLSSIAPDGHLSNSYSSWDSSKCIVGQLCNSSNSNISISISENHHHTNHNFGLFIIGFVSIAIFISSLIIVCLVALVFGFYTLITQRSNSPA